MSQEPPGSGSPAFRDALEIVRSGCLGPSRRTWVIDWLEAGLGHDALVGSRQLSVAVKQMALCSALAAGAGEGLVAALGEGAGEGAVEDSGLAEATGVTETSGAAEGATLAEAWGETAAAGEVAVFGVGRAAAL